MNERDKIKRLTPDSFKNMVEVIAELGIVLSEFNAVMLSFFSRPDVRKIIIEVMEAIDSGEIEDEEEVPHDIGGGS